MSKYKTHCKCQNPMIWSISPSEIQPQTPDRLPDETRRTCSSDGNPNVIAKIHNLRGAVEGGDGVAIVLGVLQKLEEVVSSDNSGRDVAGSNHGCSCLDPVGQLAAEEELWQIFCSRKKRTWRREARTREHVEYRTIFGRLVIPLISRYPPGYDPSIHPSILHDPSIHPPLRSFSLHYTYRYFLYSHVLECYTNGPVCLHVFHTRTGMYRILEQLRQSPPANQQQQFVQSRRSLSRQKNVACPNATANLFRTRQEFVLQNNLLHILIPLLVRRSRGLARRFLLSTIRSE